MKKALYAKKLIKRFGSVEALNVDEISIEQGEWVAIMGPSGSGKSTLLSLIAGMETATEGCLEIFGEKLEGMSDDERTKFRREQIGIVFQQFYLISYLHALDNVMVAQYYHSVPDKEQAIEKLIEVGLKDRLEHYPGELSGGEQQRVCIARALINDPPLLLADEPTGSLDEEHEKEILSIFSEYHKKGKTLIIVTHNEEVSRLADRCLRLKHGRLT